MTTHIIKPNTQGLAAVCGARTYDTERHISEREYFTLTSLPDVEDMCMKCVAKLGPPNPNDY